MTSEDYRLLKLFHHRLTLDDVRRRAESEQEAQKILYAFEQFVSEMDKNGKVTIK